MIPIFINHYSSHHGVYSGYDCLINYFKGVVIPSSKEILPYRLRKLIYKFISKNSGNYDSQSIEKEWQVFKKLRSSSNQQVSVHYLNVERDLRFVPMFYKKRENFKFLGSFHYPPEILKRIITNLRYLKNLNGAIAVGPNQVSFLQNWLNIEKVTFIPHGVDTNFFYPSASKKNGTRLLFVGQHMRDFDALNYAIERITEKIPDAIFQAVVHKAYVEKIKNFNNKVEIYTGISDENLRSLYQNATLLFLPLKDSTACNSILEALACGLPIVTTDVGGNYGYIDESCSVSIKPNDFKGHLDSAIELLKSPDNLFEMGNAGRLKSLDYSWHKVAEKVANFHQSLFHN